MKNELLEKNKNIIQIFSLLIGIVMIAGNLIYNTIVLNEELKNDIDNNKTQIERLENKYDYQYKQLNNNKVNIDLFKMLDERLIRIENKLDKLQENN